MVMASEAFVKVQQLYCVGFHVDDSEVTLNVCLGKQFSGGELFFRGVRCDKHVNTETQSEVQNSFQATFFCLQYALVKFSCSDTFLRKCDY